jgi:hypothetical protein
LLRLRTDGSLDEAFRSNFGNTWDTIAYNVARREDGKLVVNAFFRKGPGIARVTADGLVDNTFATSGITDLYVSRFAMPSDNALLLGVPGKLSRLTALQSQIITFPAVPDKVTTDSPFALDATASSGLPVLYSVLSGPATVAGNTVTLTGMPGTVTIRAGQAGNAAYAPAPQVEVTFRVEAVLGVDNVEAKINLYPNPAPGSFWVEAPDRIAASDLRLYDARGRAVATSVMPVPSGGYVGVKDAHPGLYLLHLRIGGREITRKVLLH